MSDRQQADSAELIARLRVAAGNLDHYSYPCDKSDRAWMAEQFRAAVKALEAAEARIAHLQAEYAAVTMHTVAQLEEELHAAEAKLAAIDALHQTWDEKRCIHCVQPWPCPTHRILHPEEQS